MKAIVCTSCGASRWEENGNYRTCLHCGTKYEIQSVEQYIRGEARSALPQGNHERKVDTVISIGSDVARLLNRCRTDPANAAKYANLVLDIDPTNLEALSYVRGRRRR